VGVFNFETRVLEMSSASTRLASGLIRPDVEVRFALESVGQIGVCKGERKVMVIDWS